MRVSRRTGFLIGLVVAILAASSTLLIGDLSPGFGSDSLSSASCRPSGNPGATVHVSLTDGGGLMMGSSPMMVRLSVDPPSARTGKVTFVATNYGRLNHELIVLPMPSDGLGTRPIGPDGKVEESASLGEASRSCGEGAGDGITPGSRSWVTIDLNPGSYELICDQPWHYANGMYAAFTVTNS